MTQVHNYRPISILTSSSKVFENVFKVQITDLFEQYKLFSNAQFGFRNNKSTIRVINKLIEFIVNCIKNGDYAGMIMCDLSKAFDIFSVNIQMLNDLCSLFQKKTYEFLSARKLVRSTLCRDSCHARTREFLFMWEIPEQS